jgi:hypothetical protein
MKVVEAYIPLLYVKVDALQNQLLSVLHLEAPSNGGHILLWIPRIHEGDHK